MNTRDQFGNYLLLKKLTEDALGETFRAGRIGRQSLDRVVLLRVYNGQGLDSERIAKTIQLRGGLAGALKSPNVASAIDSGQVRGVPYVAYDYVSGRTLSQLAEQALRRGQPVPLDHALLVAERIASGLAVAYETRFGDDRVVHGVLTPHEVWVSHEGELRIAGLEAAPGVREACGHPVLKQALGRYLAPEALAGQPAAKNDDVYSVAAILFELLTAQPVPAMPAGGFGSLVEQAVVAADGGNLHPDLSGLLQRSLCPRDQRVGDVVAWHKTLAKLMADGQYNPTTFNLAFFLHNLFRDEIERETQELESERTQAIQIPEQPAPRPAEAPGEVLSSVSTATVPAADAAAVAAEAGGVRENTDVLREMYGISDKKKKAGKGGFIAAIVGGAAVVLGVGGYFLFFRGAPDTEASETPAAAAPAETAPVAPAQPAEPVETGPSPEEIQTQIAQMVEEQSKQLEAGLKQKYDEQLQALQRQLEAARRVEEQRVAQPPPETRPAETVPAPKPPEKAPTETPAEPTAKPTTTPSGQPAATEATQPEATPAQQPPVTRPAAKPPEPKPEPSVRPGDLIQPGPGVVPPRIVRKPALRYPPVAQRMRKEATVTVSVLIDHNGRVVDVKQLSSKAGFGLDEAAADYAREISWAPATKNGVKVKMWYDLRVAFTLGGR